MKSIHLSNSDATLFKTYILLYLFAVSSNLSKGQVRDIHNGAPGNRLEDSTEDLPAYGKQLLNCKWRNFAILYDSSKANEKLLLSFIKDLPKIAIPYGVYRISENETAHAVVLRQYVEKRVKHFMVISKDANKFLSDMNDLFLNYSTNVLSAFPHHSNWLFLNNGTDADAEKSLLDNVASLHLDKLNFRTLMWREGRLRQWEYIDKESLLSSECTIYPNKRNGLNGRSLSWLVAQFTFAMYIADDAFGKPQYYGPFIDMVRVVGRMLNATTVLHPPPTNPLPPIFLNYSEYMRDTSSDLGLNLFSLDYAANKELEGIYPILFEKIVAAYVYKPPPDGFVLNMVDFGGFGSSIQVIIGGTFVYAVLFYKALSFLASYYTFDSETSSITLESKALPSPCSPKSRVVSTNRTTFERNEFGLFSHEFWNIDSCQRQHKVTDPTGSKSKQEFNSSLYGKVFRTLWRLQCIIPNLEITKFLGSHVNQSTIMRPRHTSLRLFVFFWCFYVLLITSLFTGTLTATFVKPLVSPPYTSVTEILQSKDLTYGTFQNTEIIARSKFWKIGGRQWTHQLERFPITFANSPNEIRRFIEKPAEKPKIFLYYEYLIRTLKHRTDFKDLYVTKDHFQQGLLGFVAPKNSELANVVSLEIKKLHEFGVIKKMMQPYIGTESNKQRNGKKAKQITITVSFLRQLFYLLFICASVAGAVLIIEIMFCYTRTYHQEESHH